MIISFRHPIIIAKDEWAHNAIDMRDVRKENVQKSWHIEWNYSTGHRRLLIWHNLSKRWIFEDHGISNFIYRSWWERCQIWHSRSVEFPTFSQNATLIQAYWHIFLYYLFSPVLVSYKVWNNFVWSKSKWNILYILSDLKIYLQLFPWSWRHRTTSIKTPEHLYNSFVCS